MLTLSQIERKSKKPGKIYLDKEGNTLLHHIVLRSLSHQIPLDLVQSIIDKNPSLVEYQNKDGFIPAQLLERRQNHFLSANRPLRRLLINPLHDSQLKETLRKDIEITLTRHIATSESDGLDVQHLCSSESETLFQQPTLLCFSGRGAFAPPLIYGFMHKIRSSMNITDLPLNNTQVLCARYPGHSSDVYDDWQLTRQINNIFSSDSPLLYVQPFTQRYFRPLYLNSHGDRISTIKAAKNMRQLTFLGYSYGAAIIQMIADEMTQDMQKHDYSSQEIKKIQSQILTLQMGADLNPTHYQNYFRHYHILNTQDEIVFDSVRPLLPEIPSNAPNLIQTQLKSAPNQKVLLVNTTSFNNDEPPHHVATYCNEITLVQKRVKLWKNAILFNALNNSVQNAKTSKLVPLPKDLELPPKRLLFVKNQDPLKAITKQRTKICQSQKIIPASKLQSAKQRQHS